MKSAFVWSFLKNVVVPWTVPDGSVNTNLRFAQGFRRFRDGSVAAPCVSLRACQRHCRANMHLAQGFRQLRGHFVSAPCICLELLGGTATPARASPKASARTGAAPPQFHVFRLKLVRGTATPARALPKASDDSRTHPP